MREKIEYEGYLIKKVHKYKYAVYEPGTPARNRFGARCGSLPSPDVRMSVNFDSIQEAKEFIDRRFRR